MCNKRNSYQPFYRKKLIKAYGKICYFCLKDFTNTSKVSFHHIKETELKGKGRGRKERYYDIYNNPESYIPVHEKCHKIIEKKKIKMKIW